MGRGLSISGILCAWVVVAVACRGPAARPRVAPEAVARAAKANGICTQCHIDFEGEPLGLVHQNAAVTCVRCHGTSKAHMDDEVRRTKPDAVYRGASMKVFCLTCHPPVRYAVRLEHKANAALAPKARMTCTQCHGEHELVEL